MKVVENTLLRDPSTGDLVSLSAGDEVPEWATGLVGEHLLEQSVPAAVADDPEKSDTPDGSWTVADLREYARANDVDLHGATSKADILDAIGG